MVSIKFLTAINLHRFLFFIILRYFEIKLALSFNLNDPYIYKPFYSRPYNSEKYIICKDFKLDQVKDAEQLKLKIKTLETVLAGMDTNKFVYDIFPTLKLPDEYLYKMKLINCLSRKQILRLKMHS